MFSKVSWLLKPQYKNVISDYCSLLLYCLLYSLLHILPVLSYLLTLHCVAILLFDKCQISSVILGALKFIPNITAVSNGEMTIKPNWLNLTFS